MDGVTRTRLDDPHRLATLPKEFDGGKAMRRLTVDWLSEGRIEIALSFVGLSGGQPKQVQVFATVVRETTPELPAEGGAHDVAR